MTVDVAAIRAALARATPGPWEAECDSLIVSPTHTDPLIGGTEHHADAELIVLLRNQAEAFLDDVAEAERRGAVSALRSAADLATEYLIYEGHGLYAELSDRADAIEKGADF